jgi:hypothetical protein
MKILEEDLRKGERIEYKSNLEEEEFDKKILRGNKKIEWQKIED